MMSLIVMSSVVGLLLDAQSAAAAQPGAFEIAAEEPLPDSAAAEIVVETYGAGPSAQDRIPLPVRVIIRASDGTHPDGSGHGTYADGRFFADGAFAVRVSPGKTKVQLSSGPNYVPLDFSVEAAPGKRLRVRVVLHRWFTPEASGWYGGDNHVHAQHDATAVVKTGLAYAALQARANGLSYITESGSHVAYDDIDALSTDAFLLRYAPELHAGCYAGHVNTPGISGPIPRERLERLRKQPLPVQAIKKAVHELGGIVIHTHPLAPPHQLHWMGATELLSDAVLGQCADLLDIDSPKTELLWFAVLNLGNKVACSSYTDSALGRSHTLSPGDRRVYCHADTFSYRAFVDALRCGRTFATNGGPIFPFFTIAGRGGSDTIVAEPGTRYESRAETHSLYPLRSAHLIRNGNVVHAFDVKGRKGAAVLTHSFEERSRSWYALRLEDEQGHWAITSPVYFEPAAPPPVPPAHALLLEIGNCTRMSQLRRDFFAHLIVTVSPGSVLRSVVLQKDGEPIKTFTPDMDAESPSGKVAVTELHGEYEPGWFWHPSAEASVHFQADWPVRESGWYHVQATVTSGATLASDAVYFDAQSPNSSEISIAHLVGASTRFALWGYGEEMPIANVTMPFEGDHWWYPKHVFWRIHAVFDGEEHALVSGDETWAAGHFRGQTP